VEIVLALVILASLATLFAIGQTAITCLFFLRARQLRTNTVDVISTQPERPSAGPGSRHSLRKVSILKPLCGLEDQLEENLISFASLPSSYEVILSIANPNDSALTVVRKVVERFPQSPFVVVVGGITPELAANPKVERLIAASRIARGEIFFISDANIRVSPENLARTVSLLEDKSIGGVSNLFIAEGVRSFGAVIESLYLLTFVLPGTLLAYAVGTTCVVGKSMAITREVWDRIGGFEAFANMLAEDQAIGLAVKAAGYRWAISTEVVRNVIVERTLRTALGRQLRWGKIRYSFSKLLYVAEFLTNPVPLATLAAISTAFFNPDWFNQVFAFACCLLVARCLQAGILSRITTTNLSYLQILLTPIQDLLQFLVQFLPFFSREVKWKEHHVRLGPGTIILRSEHLGTDGTEIAPEPGFRWGRLS
jgi:ceramide glucosyltransferase